MIDYYNLLDSGRFDWQLRQLHLERIQEMRKPVRCAHCNRIYDLGKITEFGRYADCMTWRCPGCKILVDDRPLNLFGTATRHIYELDKETGRPRRDHSDNPASRDGYLPRGRHRDRGRHRRPPVPSGAGRLELRKPEAPAPRAAR